MELRCSNSDPNLIVRPFATCFEQQDPKVLLHSHPYALCLSLELLKENLKQKPLVTRMKLTREVRKTQRKIVKQDKNNNLLVK